MKHLLVLFGMFLLATGAYAAGSGDKPSGGGTDPDDPPKKQTAHQPSEGQALLFDLSVFNNRPDSTATIGTFGSSQRFRKISTDMTKDQKGL